MEWADWKASLCVGCGLPRDETFDPATDDSYDVEVFQCHACAARERKAYNRSLNTEVPSFGEYIAVTGLDNGQDGG